MFSVIRRCLCHPHGCFFLPVLAVLLAGPLSADGQTAAISWTNFVGQAGGYGNADGSGRAARFNGLSGVAVDGSGNVYVADTSNHTIRKVTVAGVVTTLAGSAGSSGNADGTGSAAQFNYPGGVAVDGSGNVYVADSSNHTIRKVTPGGTVTTLAGSAGSTGSADGSGGAARFNSPGGVAVDGSGNVYVADSSNHTIRKVTPGGTVTTLAGSAGSTGSTDGSGSAARFNSPGGVAVDGSGTVFVADSNNHTIRKVTPGGTVTTLAGSAGSSGSANGTGNAARFNSPTSVAVDSAGNVFVADSGHTIRKVTSLAVVTTPAGVAGSAGSADGTGSAARFNYPAGVAVDSAGNVFVADSGNHTVRQMTSSWVVTTLAGTASAAGSADGTGSAALFRFPVGSAVDSSGNVYVADYENHTIRKVTSGGAVTTLAGSAGLAGSADGTGGAASFNNPSGVAVDGSGNVYVADYNNHMIRKVTSGGVVTTLAGSAGAAGSADGTGAAAQFNYPYGVAVDASGNVFVADSGNHMIRKVTSGGVVTTLAGAGTAGSTDGTGGAAQFNYPYGVAVDASGNVYVADCYNHTVRKVTAAGVVTTLAGSAGVVGSADGNGSAAQFSYPAGVAVDSAGNVLVTDSGNHTIRSVTTGGDVTTVGGSAGVIGGADGAGRAANFATPAGVAVGGDGSVYVADSDNNRVSKGTPVDTLYAMVYKVQSLGQTNTGAAVLLPLSVNPTPFSFAAYLKRTPSGTVNGATVELPDTTVQILGTATPPSNQLDLGYKQDFTTKTAMDAAFGAGTYTFSINGQHDGARSLPLALPGDSYPSSAPHISNWTETQAVYPASDFTVRWDALPGGTAGDFVLFQIREMVSGSPSNYVFETAAPGAATALNGTNTSAVVPVGTLTQGRSYLAQLLWCRPAAVEANSYPGATGFASYGLQTMFTLATTTPAQMITPTNTSRFTSGSVTFTWNSGVGVAQYALWIGNAPATYDLYAAAEPGQSRTLTLPTDGRAIYVRLWSLIAGAWQFVDYSYTAYRNLGFGTGSVLPAGIFNNSYSQALQAVGGIGSYTWSWSGSTPPGLNLSAGGLLGGTPTAMGTYAFTLQVADGVGGVTNQNVSMLIRGQDVSYALVMKQQSFWQTNTGAAATPPPGLDPTPFAFTATLKQAPTGVVNNATVQWPDTTVSVLSALSPASQYADGFWETNFSAKAALDAAVTNGTYSFTIGAAHDGTNLLVAALTTDNYPAAAPHVSNWTASQAINAAAAFTLTWDSLTGGASNDFLWVAVKPFGVSGASNLFETPAWGSVGALNGTNISAVIPAATLTTNQTYQAEIGWCRFGPLNTTNYPGAAGAGAHVKKTRLLLHTTSPAQMLSPTNGMALADTAVTFAWDSGISASQYALWVGSTPNSYDLLAVALGTNLTRTVTLPANSQPVYVRLWSLISGDWQYLNYTYTAATPVKARMLTPLNGSTNSNTSVTFTWDAGVGVSQYALWVGTASNSYDLCAVATGTNRSQVVTVPASGSAIYVRLWSFINSNWQYNDYSCTAAMPLPAAMLSPANGSTNNSASVTFTWDAGVGATQYALWVGSAAETYDLYAQAVGTNLSRTLTLPVDGRSLYLRLWSLMDSGWLFNDYTYRAFNPMKAKFTGLTNGQALVSSTVNFNWDTGVGATQYRLVVGSSSGWSDIYNGAAGAAQSQSVALPSDGRQLYVSLGSLVNGTWKTNNYVFTANAAASSRAAMIAPTNGTVFATNPVTFTWSAGTNVTQYALWVGSTPATYGLAAIATGTNQTQQLTLPLDSDPIYVRLWSFVGGAWECNDYAYSTVAPGGAVKAQMTSHANGDTLAAASTTFTWSTGTNVTQYALWVGSAPATYDLYAAAEPTTSRTLTLPADGGPIYVRLWSFINSTWTFYDYYYTAFYAP